MTIQFDNVTLRYHYDNYDVLTDATFTLHDGVNTVLCDIQSGKGTICKLILGNLAPTSGRVLINGRDASTLPNKEMNALYLSNTPTFFENRSVLYNLQYPLRVRNALKQNVETVAQLADEFGLSELLDKKVKTLTSPQKLKLSLSRGLTVHRDVVLFDGFFDDTSWMELLSELSQEQVVNRFDGTKVVLTTKADVITGNTVVMDGGQCVFQGDADGAKQTLAQLEWLADKIQPYN